MIVKMSRLKVNLLSRQWHGSYFKDSRYRPLQNVCPSLSVIGGLFVALSVTSVSERLLCCDKGFLYRFLHIGIGGLCLCLILTFIYLKESDVVRFVKEQYRNRHKH